MDREKIQDAIDYVTTKDPEYLEAFMKRVYPDPEDRRTAPRVL